MPFLFFWLAPPQLPRHYSQAPCSWLQVKRTCYAQSSQIRQIRRKMVEIMTREASSCDLKELVGKFIPEAIGEDLRPT